jgi:hypothetical protein
MTSKLDKLPLRDLLNIVERHCRELAEHLQMDLNPSVSELHELSRTKRKRSHYPAMRAVSNAYEKLAHSYRYAVSLTEKIEECVTAIEQRIAELSR